MVYNRYRAQIVVRSILIFATIAVAIWLFLSGGFVVTAILLGVITIVQIGLYVRYSERTERDLVRFFNAIAYDDFEENFRSNRTVESRNLNAAFANIIGQFRRVRGQREAHYRYLKAIIDHAGTGLIAFDRDGRVDLANHSALRLFDLDHLTNIKQLDPKAPGIVEILSSINANERRIQRLTNSYGMTEVVIDAIKFRRENNLLTLISLQNISTELEAREVETWQLILRSITHEIRNSMTPIASLATTAISYLDTPKQLANDPEIVSDVKLALSTIEQRSQGLLRFCDAYRTLAQVPAPRLKEESMLAIFEHIRSCFQAQFRQHSIFHFFSVDPPDMSLMVDIDLIEQVMINLIANAMEAMENRSDKRIEVKARSDDFGNIIVEVSDNGPGLKTDVEAKIFVPFFSTKKEGSGIGLSLSRLILRQHNASITVESIPNQRTTFTIVFPASLNLHSQKQSTENSNFISTQ